MTNPAPVPALSKPRVLVARTYAQLWARVVADLVLAAGLIATAGPELVRAHPDWRWLPLIVAAAGALTSAVSHGQDVSAAKKAE